MHNVPSVKQFFAEKEKEKQKVVDEHFKVCIDTVFEFIELKGLVANQERMTLYVYPENVSRIIDTIRDVIGLQCNYFASTNKIFENRVELDLSLSWDAST